MNYCCDRMEKLDKENKADFCPGFLTTLDWDECWPIHYCPFCGKELPGTKKAVDELENRLNFKEE